MYIYYYFPPKQHGRKNRVKRILSVSCDLWSAQCKYIVDINSEGIIRNQY